MGIDVTLSLLYVTSYNIKKAFIIHSFIHTLITIFFFFFQFQTTGLFLSGIALYSGAQYKRSFNRQPESLKPILWAGGALLLAGWLSFLL